MTIEIKKSKKPIKYEDAIRFMERRLLDVNSNKSNELIWTLEHNDLYTAGTNYNENEIIVTAGVQESISLAMLSLLNEDDEVLITSPRFTTYDLTVRMCKAKPVPIPTYEENNFALMPHIIENQINKKTKIIVLVSPNNPTGAVTPPENIKKRRLEMNPALRSQFNGVFIVGNHNLT